MRNYKLFAEEVAQLAAAAALAAPADVRMERMDAAANAARIAATLAEVPTNAECTPQIWDLCVCLASAYHAARGSN